jgi:hypothetical protein
MIANRPANHLDMESIEALNLALENYEGTLIFLFISVKLCTCIVYPHSIMIDFQELQTKVN